MHTRIKHGFETWSLPDVNVYCLLSSTAHTISYELCFAAQLILALCIGNSSFIRMQGLMGNFSLGANSTYKCHLQCFIILGLWGSNIEYLQNEWTSPWEAGSNNQLVKNLPCKMRAWVWSLTHVWGHTFVVPVLGCSGQEAPWGQPV